MEEKKKSFIKELIPYLIIIILVVLIRTFIMTPVIVEGTSMNPTLYDNTIIILNKISKVKRYDIVVASTEEEGKLIKRVMALPGESIECKDGEIYINDEIIEDKTSIETNDFEKIILKEDEYFLMGDNRLVSLDSRKLGPISKEQIKGTTSFAIWPFKYFGTFN